LKRIPGLIEPAASGASVSAPATAKAKEVAA
jgi:hypothetical protein